MNKEKEVMELTAEEKKILKESREKINRYVSLWGDLRIKFSLSEKKLLTAYENDYNFYIDFLNNLAKNKELDTKEWAFDQDNLVFRKK